MPYNSMISRTDSQALIPEDVAGEILEHVPVLNPMMTLARRLPNLSRAQRRLPVVSALATAYFVAGEATKKQTTEVNWDNKYIDAEELAVIVPVPEAVLDDVNYDIWSQIRPEIERAFSIAISRAVLFGTNIPATWTTNLGGAGLLAVAGSVSLAAYTDMYEAILGETGAGVPGLFGTIEADGYMVTGSIAHLSMKGKLRNTRTTDGGVIFMQSMQSGGQYMLDSTPVYFPTDGTIPSASALMVSGQWDQLVYAMRQDITYKILDQAVIQDAAGTIIYNLAQQDMVALRAVMRLGFALPNPINRVNETAATRCAFQFLTA